MYVDINQCQSVVANFPNDIESIFCIWNIFYVDSRIFPLLFKKNFLYLMRIYLKKFIN